MAVLAFVAFTTILIASLLAGHAIHSHKFRYATEGSAAMVLGTTIAGTLWLLWFAIHNSPLPPTTLTLPDTVFFNILLPPIIFFAGFSIKKRMFFANFATIISFGFLGTLVSAGAITAAATTALGALGLAPKLLMQSSLALGAICACSDTVAILQIVDKAAHPVLHSIIFGEGIVNDAVAVVLLGAVNSLTASASSASAGSGVQLLLELLLSFLQLFGCSLGLGVSMGLLSALLMRHVFGRHHDCDREVLLLALLGFLSYLLADAAELSPILSVFSCGVTMSHYSWHSMGAAAQALAIHTFRVAASLMEMVLYAFSGINIWTSALWQQPDGGGRMHLKHALALASVLLVAIIVARVAFTCLAVAASQLWNSASTAQTGLGRQKPPLSWLDAMVITVGGLSRGAITLALAYHHFSPQHKGLHAADQQVMILAVVVVVLVSTLSLGALTGPLMQFIMSQRQQQHQSQQLQQQRLQQRRQQQAGTEAHTPLLQRTHKEPAAPRPGADIEAQPDSAGRMPQQQQASAAPAAATALAAAELQAPVARAAASSQDVDAAALATYLALSHAPAGPAASDGGGSRSGDVAAAAAPAWWQRVAPGAASSTPAGSDVVVQQQQGSGAGTPLREQQQWYLRQQWLLLQQQIEQLQHQQEAERDQQESGLLLAAAASRQPWSLHAAWRWLDHRFLQQIFGGRDMAASVVPADFEHFGIGS